MCVIAVIPKGTTIPSFSLFKQAWDRNPDGAGFMYSSADGRLVIHKGLMTFTEFKQCFKQHGDSFSVDSAGAAQGAGPVATQDLCVHFRIRSHGPVDKKCTHPFFIPGHQDVAIAHNGIISGLPSSKTRSDTLVYIDTLIKHLPLGWQRNPAVQYLMQSDIGPGNKFVIFDKDGLCAILNKAAGYELNGVWWSNRYHLLSFSAPHQRQECSNTDAFAAFDDDGFETKPAAPARKPMTICKASFNPDEKVMHLIVDNHDGLGKCTMRLTLSEAVAMRARLNAGLVESECQLSGGMPFTSHLRDFYKAVKGTDLPPIGALTISAMEGK